MTTKGLIIKSVGGFYTVETPIGVICCGARGIFRKRKISPSAGDYVKIEDDVITEICPRKNYLIRPPIANLDVALIVVSTCEPEPNGYILDKLIAIFEDKQIQPRLVFTKSDLTLCGEFIDIYRKAGFICYVVNNMNGDGTEEIVRDIDGKITALIGNSGVGKSSLINIFLPDIVKETSEISKKLGRGKHTTRTVEMYRMNDGFIIDTPGFSTVDIDRYGHIQKENLQLCFREFRSYVGKCKYNDCVHIKEQGCELLKAVEEGVISKSRHDSYVRLYNEAKAAENEY